MITGFTSFIKELETKPSWGAKELTAKIHKLSETISNDLEEQGKLITVSSKKKTTVKTLKKYDILYLPLVGIPHYFMVHRIVEGNAYGVIFTSSDSDAHVIHKVEKDRVLEGSFVSNAYLCVEVRDAQKAFIRTYEDKKEGGTIFKKVITHYQTLFKIK